MICEEYLRNTSNLIVLYNLKRDGFPRTIEEQTLLFKKFNQRGNGDYPVSWEHLCEFLPEVNKIFGQDRYLQIHKEYNLMGDMETAINKSGMPELEKAFMYFVYEIKERGTKKNV